MDTNEGGTDYLDDYLDDNLDDNLDDEIDDIIADLGKLGGTPTHIIIRPEIARAVIEWCDYWDALPWWRKALHRAWWAWCDAAEKMAWIR